MRDAANARTLINGFESELAQARDTNKSNVAQIALLNDKLIEAESEVSIGKDYRTRFERLSSEYNNVTRQQSAHMTELSNASKIALLQASHRTQVVSIARSADNERASQDRITASTQAALLQNQLTVLQASETANALRNDSLQSTVTNMSIRHADSLNTVQTNTSAAVADLTVKHLTEIAERDRNPQHVVNINNVQTNASVPCC